MKLTIIACALLAALFSCNKSDIRNPAPDKKLIQLPNADDSDLSSISAASASVPRPDHIIFAWFENHQYSQIVGNSQAPYINSLIPKATLLTNMFALTHPSYPNYIAMFSGSTQGVTTDGCLTNRPFDKPNLYTVLHKISKSFAWYSEDLPKMGAVVCSYNNYQQKHNPTTAFKNVADNANKPFNMFNWSDTSASNMSKLETVVCITPNKLHSMHDQVITYQGDQWLKSKLSKVIEWCRRHNSIFVIYYDEGTSHSNQLAVMLLGLHVKRNFKLATKYNHYSFTKFVAHTYNADSTYNSNLKNAKGVSGFYF